MENFKEIDLGFDLDFNKPMFLKNLVDEGELSIFVSQSGSDENLKISFSSVYSYRNTNESYRLKTSFVREGKIPTLLSIVENSTFLRWFQEESQYIYSEENLRHFMIFTNEEVIDVISNIDPDVSYDC